MHVKQFSVGATTPGVNSKMTYNPSDYTLSLGKQQGTITRAESYLKQATSSFCRMFSSHLGICSVFSLKEVQSERDNQVAGARSEGLKAGRAGVSSAHSWLGSGWILNG